MDTQTDENPAPNGKGKALDIHVGQLPEGLMDALKKVNDGKGPAIMEFELEDGEQPNDPAVQDRMIEKLTETGVKLGLPEDKAREKAESAVKRVAEIMAKGPDRMPGNPKGLHIPGFQENEEVVLPNVPRHAWRKVREAYDYFKFKGLDIRKHEGKGFWRRNFFFRGDAESVDTMRDWALANGGDVR